MKTLLLLSLLLKTLSTESVSSNKTKLLCPTSWILQRWWVKLAKKIFLCLIHKKTEKTDEDGLFVDFLNEKVFSFQYQSELFIYLPSSGKLFFRQEINCDVVSFIRNKSSIKMENIFSIEFFHKWNWHETGIISRQVGGRFRFLRGTGGGGGGGSLSLVFKYPGGNVQNWLPINCNLGKKYGGNPKNYRYLDTLIISLTVIFNYHKTEFFHQKQMEQFRHQVLLMSAAWTNLEN